MTDNQNQLHSNTQNLVNDLLKNVITIEVTTKTGIDRFSNLYEIAGFIGKGSFGFVVSGIEIESGRECAIKVLA